MKSNVKIFVSVIVLLVIGVVASVLMGAGNDGMSAGPGKYDQFAQCIADKGAKFYGAFWCPHCQTQKKLFGKSAKLLPYIECSTADGNGQLQICKDENIEGYPTWVFADGTQASGEQTFEQLAAKTSCELPVETAE